MSHICSFDEQKIIYRQGCRRHIFLRFSNCFAELLQFDLYRLAAADVFACSAVDHLRGAGLKAQKSLLSDHHVESEQD